MDAAIEILETVVEKTRGSPQGREAQGRLARLYSKKTNELKQSLTTSEKDVEQAVQWGQRLFRRNYLDDSQEILSAVIAHITGWGTCT